MSDSCVCGEDRPKRLGNGWIEVGGQVFCDKCSKRYFVLRAPSIRVSGPANMEWPELRKIMDNGFRLVTALSNMVADKLRLLDGPRRLRDDENLPPLHFDKVRVQVYHAVREEFPELATATVQSVIQNIGRHYRKHRRAIWFGMEGWRNMRFPQPIPMKNNAWTPLIEVSPPARREKTKKKQKKGGGASANRPLIRFNLFPGGEPIVLRLAGGKEYYRQRQDFDTLVRGEGKQGELVLYEITVSEADHRGQLKKKKALMAKMVGYYPRKQRGALSGAFIVTTDANSLLVGLDHKVVELEDPWEGIDKEETRLWVINRDDLKRRQAQIKRFVERHEREVQRWAQDSKMEARKHVPFAERREAACRKYDNRMNSAAAEIAAQVVSYAKRRRFAELIWVKREECFLPDWRWHRLETEMAWRCEAESIKFTSGLNPVPKEPA